MKNQTCGLKIGCPHCVPKEERERRRAEKKKKKK